MAEGKYPSPPLGPSQGHRHTEPSGGTLSAITETGGKYWGASPLLWMQPPLQTLEQEEGSPGVEPEGLPGEGTAKATQQRRDGMASADKGQSVQGRRPLY